MTPFEALMGPDRLEARGPIIGVVLTRSGAKGRDTLLRVDLKALIDTGAECTVVRKGRHAALGIEPDHQGVVTTVAGDSSPSAVFRSQLWLPTNEPGGEWSCWTGAVVELGALDGEAGGIECLIGRDILRHFDLEYHGASGLYRLTMAKPS